MTLLISGLTAAQDFLVEGALGGLGYKIKNIGWPDQEGLQVGVLEAVRLERCSCVPAKFPARLR